MDRHKISVIIPAYNAERTIGRTLASLLSNRDYIEEVIIVDDGSTDRTLVSAAEFLGHLNLVMISLDKNKGPGNARRVGIENATGEWITFVDADDCVTASAFRYVSELWLGDEQLVLLHAKTIYYESGNFVSSNIDYSDMSCGGNFYRRSYLTDNGLVLKKYPRLCEDEFFNEVVTGYLADDEYYHADHYNYPTYEVHHDMDDGLSYATRNWKDYLIKCRLEKARMVCDCLHKDLKDSLAADFAFSFTLLNGLMQDADFELTSADYADIFADFKKTEQYYVKRFKGKREELVKYYLDNKDALYAGATATIGFEYEEMLGILEFFNMIDGKVD